jgi:hypothetical protein
MDCGEEPHLVLAAGTLDNMDFPYPLHQFGPRIVTFVDGGNGKQIEAET